MNNIKFRSPSSAGIYGASQTGKTYFTAKLLRNAAYLYTIPPERILFCYQEMQPIFEELENELSNITFKRGLPTEEDLVELTSSKNHTLLVLDDLMMESQSSKFVERIFCVLSHHLNLSVLTLQQNVFYQGKNSRTISLQLHYFVLFQNNRDKSQILTLARQIAPGKTNSFMEIYNDCMSRPYSYLVIDLAPNSKEEYKFRTNIFAQLPNNRDSSSDTFPVVYRMI